MNMPTQIRLRVGCGDVSRPLTRVTDDATSVSRLHSNNIITLQCISHYYVMCAPRWNF